MKNNKVLIYVSVISVLFLVFSLTAASAFSLPGFIKNMFSSQRVTGNSVSDPVVIFQDMFLGNTISSDWNLWRMQFGQDNNDLVTLPAYKVGFYYMLSGRSAIALTHIGDTTWNNYTVEAAIENLPAGGYNPGATSPCYRGSGIMFRVVNASENWNYPENDFYTFFLETRDCSGWSTKGNWVIQKDRGYWIPGHGWSDNNSGSSETLSSGNIASFTNDGINDIKITAVGNNFAVWVNGNLVKSFTDNQNALNYGGVGATWGWDSMGKLHNITVTSASSDDLPPSPPLSLSLCKDSDGINYYNQGNVSSNNAIYYDTCTNASTLQEFYCVGNNYRSVNYQCQYGCVSGACLNSSSSNSSVLTCNDTDGGLNYYVPGSAKGIPSLVIKLNVTITLPDTCVNSTLLSEAECYNGYVLPYKYSCPYGCINNSNGLGSCAYGNPASSNSTVNVSSLNNTNVGNSTLVTENVSLNSSSNNATIPANQTTSANNTNSSSQSPSQSINQCTIGNRTNAQYCDINGTFEKQKNDSSSCQKNYE